MPAPKLVDLIARKKVSARALEGLSPLKKMQVMEERGPESCRAGIFCIQRDDPNYESYCQLRDQFVKACKVLNQWFDPKQLATNRPSMELPTANTAMCNKYLFEIQRAKDEMVLEIDKKGLCPLYPLIAFPTLDNRH
jgi:hypothetical protein